MHICMRQQTSQHRAMAAASIKSRCASLLCFANLPNAKLSRRGSCDTNALYFLNAEAVAVPVWLPEALKDPSMSAVLLSAVSGRSCP